MSDLLIYRFPEGEIVRQRGKFSKHPDGTAPEGFIVTDFLHQNVWSFTVEGIAEPNAVLHISSQSPVVISPRDYQIESQAMLHAFEACGVEKAVYSRVKAVSFPIDKGFDLFDALASTYPKAFVYLISSEHFGTWIGATPEVLIDGRNDKLTTIALAGTHSHDENRQWSDKELDEHRFVAEAVEETLKRNGAVTIEIDGPNVVTAGPVDHLRTDFKVTIPRSEYWQVAMDLHPTPAVCGTPRMAALDLLLSREMHDRGLYTGIIGINGSAESTLFVNLRCAQLQQSQAYLYVGGGYTRESIPDLEWEESENKARTLLNCIEKL